MASEKDSVSTASAPEECRRVQESIPGDESGLAEILNRLALDRINQNNNADEEEDNPISSNSDVNYARDQLESNNNESKSAIDDTLTSEEIKDSKKPKKRPSFGFIRRLSSGGSLSSKDASGSSSNRKPTKTELKGQLPQQFLAKQLGSRPCTGLWGIEHVRGPVDQMVHDVQEPSRTSGDCSLVNLVVDETGLHVSEHRKNKGPSLVPNHVPIEYISYVVQDRRFTRVFCFILVREMSYRGKTTECHAYLCDKPPTARSLSLAFALAFNQYCQKLHGKPFRFQVDLQNPDAIVGQREEEEESRKKSKDMLECDA